jgi:hypothetical protein
MATTSTFYLIFLDFITLTILGEAHKLWNSSLFNLINPVLLNHLEQFSVLNCKTISYAAYNYWESNHMVGMYFLLTQENGIKNFFVNT